jgi:hypothetical protein
MKKLIGFGVLLLAWGSVWAGTQENDLIRLAKSGVDAEVLGSYVEAARGPFHLTVDQIIELNKLGVSSSVISAALKHQGSAAAYTGQGGNGSYPVQPEEQPYAAPYTAPDTQVVVTPPQVSVYPDPYYYDYGPYFGLGLGWGWGPGYYGYGWGGRGGYYGRGIGVRGSVGFRSAGPVSRGGGGGSRGFNGGGRGFSGGGHGGGHR